MKKWCIDFYNRNLTVINIILTVLAILGFAWGFYSYYNPVDRNPHLTIYQKTLTNLFELHSENKDLKVFFKDKDILKEKLNIRIVTLKLINDGKADIAARDFDLTRQPLGFIIKNGKIISAETYGQSSNVLRNLVDSSNCDSTHFMFTAFLFPKKEFFYVRITILFDTRKEPQVLSIGSFPNIEKYYTAEEEITSVWGYANNVFAIIILCFVVVAIGSVIISVVFFIQKVYRQTKIRKLYRYYYQGIPKFQKTIKEIYLKNGKRGLQELKESLPDRGIAFMQSSSEYASSLAYDGCLEKTIIADKNYWQYSEVFITELEQIFKLLGI